MNNPEKRAWRGLVILAVVMGLLLFIPAGTLRYWPAWGYLEVFFGASILITLHLMKHDPALLERRSRAGPTAEKEKAQQIIQFFTSAGFIAIVAVSSLDFRFKWSDMRFELIMAGDVMTAVGFYIVFLVYRENPFSSATIEIASDQTVISTGPYAVVRHPMYSGGLILLLGTPIALGSYWALLAMAAIMPFLVWRLFDEERFLAKNLAGYTEYCAKVRWRLIPGVF
jgi:protein-S-isoprenylcysteine O-methyltransferase Ste14